MNSVQIWRSFGVFIANFEQISYVVMVFALLWIIYCTKKKNQAKESFFS